MTPNKSNPRKIESIDEAFLLQSIKEQDDEPKNKQPEVKEAQDAPELVPEKPKRKRNVNADYSSLFLQRNEFKARQCVYISQRVHTTISEIVRVIADRDVTVGGYIDNVLIQHLEAHKDEINDLYKRERKDLIEY